MNETLRTIEHDSKAMNLRLNDNLTVKAFNFTLEELCFPYIRFTADEKKTCEETI